MAKIVELGSFAEEDNKFTPVNFDYTGRQLWLYKIQCIDYKEVGSSNYTYDQIGKYNLIFHINSGDNNRSYKISEEYYCILQLEIAEWYRPEDLLKLEITESLLPFPILNINDVTDAFKQRHYYSDTNEIEIIKEE
jgi:hypothetical protein